MKNIYAFGQLVSVEIINELQNELPDKEITSELIETLYEYEFRDNK